MFPSVHSAYMHTPAVADTIATPLTSCTSTLQNSILISVGGVSLTAKQLRSSTHGFGVICRGECGHLSRFASISCYAKSGDPHILQTPQRGLIGACCLLALGPTNLHTSLLFAVLNREYLPQSVLSAGAALEACHTKIP